jgi:hypothetical protein
VQYKYSIYIFICYTSPGPKWSNQHTLVQPTEPGPTEPATSPTCPITGPQNLDPRQNSPFGNCRRLYSPQNLCPVFLSRGPKIDLFSHALGDRGGDFFGAKRIVAESGGEGSREQWSNTRLRLPSVAAVVSWSVTFLAAGFVVWGFVV